MARFSMLDSSCLAILALFFVLLIATYPANASENSISAVASTKSFPTKSTLHIRELVPTSSTSDAESSTTTSDANPSMATTNTESSTTTSTSSKHETEPYLGTRQTKSKSFTQNPTYNKTSTSKTREPKSNSGMQSRSYTHPNTQSTKPESKSSVRSRTMSCTETHEPKHHSRPHKTEPHSKPHKTHSYPEPHKTKSPSKPHITYSNPEPCGTKSSSKPYKTHSHSKPHKTKPFSKPHKTKSLSKPCKAHTSSEPHKTFTSSEPYETKSCKKLHKTHPCSDAPSANHTTVSKVPRFELFASSNIQEEPKFVSGYGCHNHGLTTVGQVRFMLGPLANLTFYDNSDCHGNATLVVGKVVLTTIPEEAINSVSVNVEKK